MKTLNYNDALKRIDELENLIINQNFMIDKMNKLNQKNQVLVDGVKAMMNADLTSIKDMKLQKKIAMAIEIAMLEIAEVNNNE